MTLIVHKRCTVQIYLCCVVYVAMTEREREKCPQCSVRRKTVYLCHCTLEMFTVFSVSVSLCMGVPVCTWVTLCLILQPWKRADSRAGGAGDHWPTSFFLSLSLSPSHARQCKCTHCTRERRRSEKLTVSTKCHYSREREKWNTVKYLISVLRKAHCKSRRQPMRIVEERKKV